MNLIVIRRTLNFKVFNEKIFPCDNDSCRVGNVFILKVLCIAKLNKIQRNANFERIIL